MIVGLIGRRRSGKDTAAAALAKDGFHIIKFADGLKIMLRALLKSLDYSDFRIERMVEGDLKEESISILGDKSPRYLMQTLGTEWGRDLVSTMLWVDIAIYRAKQFPNVVISDCRFPNEAEAIVRADGILIRIERSMNRCDDVDNHPSESLTDYIRPHFTLVNNGTIGELERAVRVLMTLRPWE